MGNPDVTGISVAVESTIDAPPEQVWELLAEVTHVGSWSPECVHAAWADPETAPGVGARFNGRNRASSGFEWEVSCVVTEYERPRAFAWIVLDGDKNDQRPSSSWRYDLEPLPGARTHVRHVFEHGPGDSGLRWWIREHPEQDPAEIIEGRRNTLRRNMTTTMAAMASAATAG